MPTRHLACPERVEGALATRHLRHCIWVILALFTTACESIFMPTSVPATHTPIATRAVEAITSTPVLVAFPTAAPPSPTPILPAVPLATGVPTALPSPRAPSSAPIVQMVSPLANAQISANQTFYVVAYAADDVGVTRIELSDDGNSVRAENAPPPAPPVFSAILPWTPTQIGSHILRVVAFDATNRASAADEATVNVIQDARRLTSIIVYPIGTPQVDFGSVLQMAGVATDEVGVMQLDLFVDNQMYTYVTAQNPGGQTLFPFVFAWNALLPGTHTFFVRAHDTQDQTTDSSPLKVLVVNTQTPVLNVAFEQTNALVSEPITITLSALDASGIQRVELWSGKETISTITSGSPARQTSLTTQVVWQSANPGDYQISARAYNANGNVKESPAQTISILRPGQSTPTPAPTITPTRTRVPRATPTPRLQPPPPPSAELLQPADRFSSPSPLRVTFSGTGNAELDHIELWGYTQGQLFPQVICTVDSHATTQKAGQCEWSPPGAGVVFIFAQAVDIYRQSGRSATVSGYVGVPTLPTPTPTPPSLAGRWSAATSTGPMTVTWRQVGTTLRGDFKMAGVETTGRITASALKGDRLTFSVDFASSETPTPGATTTASPTVVAPAMDFDCVMDSAMSTLTCTFRDARGRSGSAQFRRETTP